MNFASKTSKMFEPYHVKKMLKVLCHLFRVICWHPCATLWVHAFITFVEVELKDPAEPSVRLFQSAACAAQRFRRWKRLPRGSSIPWARSRDAGRGRMGEDRITSWGQQSVVWLCWCHIIAKFLCDHEPFIGSSFVCVDQNRAAWADFAKRSDQDIKVQRPLLSVLFFARLVNGCHTLCSVCQRFWRGGGRSKGVSGCSGIAGRPNSAIEPRGSFAVGLGACVWPLLDLWLRGHGVGHGW